MAKINAGKKTGDAKTDKNRAMKGRTEVSPRTDQNGAVPGKPDDRVLLYIKEGRQMIRELADIFETVSTVVNRSKTTDVDNYVKIYKVDNENTKEKNRHDEEMARIENEWKKISSAEADRKDWRMFINDQSELFRKEYKRYLDMKQPEFLSDEVTKRLETLRKDIIGLIKELNRS